MNVIYININVYGISKFYSLNTKILGSIKALNDHNLSREMSQNDLDQFRITGQVISFSSINIYRAF